MQQDGLQPSADTPGKPPLISNRYRPGLILGRGTFGQVYQAEDIKYKPPRLVALKILHQHLLNDPGLLDEIEREASVLAQFAHPNILRVLDFEVNFEQAFIVTELAAGGSLARKLRPDPSKPPVRLSFEEIAYYLQLIAEGLDEAHSKGLIHRDLKPLNILLDSRGCPLIADFGLATALVHSHSSAIIDVDTSGTPAYMAPELWHGQAGRASDIYALAVITYQLLTGQLPFQGDSHALAYQHLNAPVPLLSFHAPDLVYPSDLDQIIAHAMNKDPYLRTRPAIEFYNQVYSCLADSSFIVKHKSASDINDVKDNAFQSLPDQPSNIVNTQNISPQRSQSTNPAIAFDTSHITHTEGSSAPAKIGKGTGLSQSKLAPSIFHKVVAPYHLVTISRKVHNFQLLGAVGSIFFVLIILVVWVTSNLSKSTLPYPTASVTTINATNPTSSIKATPTFSTSILLSTRFTLSGHTNSIIDVALSPDGKILASASADQTIRLWDTISGKSIGQPLIGHTHFVVSIAFSPDGKTLASAGNDNTIRLWDTATGQPIGQPLIGHTNWVRSVIFSPNGKILASGSWDNTIRLWDTASGKPIGQPLTGHTNYVVSLAYSPDGKILASGSWDNTLRLWDTATGQLIGQPVTGHTTILNSIAFSSDGSILASGSDDKTIRLWNPVSGQLMGQPLTGHTGVVNSVVFKPNSKILASGSADTTIRLWDTTSGQLIGQPYTGHTDTVNSVAFSFDGKMLASGSDDKTIRLWNILGG